MAVVIHFPNTRETCPVVRQVHLQAAFIEAARRTIAERRKSGDTATVERMERFIESASGAAFALAGASDG